MITKNEISSLNLSPTKKDFVQIWNELIEVASKITERWDPTSTNESDPGIVLLKVLTGIADKLNYNIDKNVLEAFMPTAAQMESMRKLCELMGYDIKYYQSAKTKVRITYTGDEELPPEGLQLPKFTSITNADKDITFVTTNTLPVFITNTIPWVEVDCIEGQISQCESINENNLITLSQLDDNNRYYLPEIQIAENGIFVYNAATSGSEYTDGLSWEQVSNLNTQAADTRVFKFGYDSLEGRPYLAFPEDVGNLIGDGLFIYFIRTSGLNGNISPRALEALEVPTNASWENYSAEQFEVVNVDATTNGANIESISAAYNNFKKTVGTFDTLVTCRDYMNKIYSLMNASGSPYVSNILVTDIRNDINKAITLCSCNEFGILYKETPLTETVQNHYTSRRVVETSENNVYKLIIDPDQNVKTEIPLIDHFDLLLYPFKTFTQVSFATEDLAKPYDTSFTYTEQNNDEIVAELEDFKTCAHNITTPEEGDIVAINNYLRLNALIATSTKVSEIEAESILQNVKVALVNEFNLRNLDFGEEIPFDSILSVIENADSRIKVVSLQEPTVLTTYSVKEKVDGTFTSKEYGIASTADDKISGVRYTNKDGGDYTTKKGETAKDLYNKLVLRNILAGRASLFNYDETFVANNSEKPYAITANITTELKLDGSDEDLSDSAKLIRTEAIAIIDKLDNGKSIEEILVSSGLSDGVVTLRASKDSSGVVTKNIYETYTPALLLDTDNQPTIKGDIIDNVTRIEATCEISSTSEDGLFNNITLDKNEVIKFRAPNLRTTKTFPAYVYYHFEHKDATGNSGDNTLTGSAYGSFATAMTLSEFINQDSVRAINFFEKLWSKAGVDFSSESYTFKAEQADAGNPKIPSTGKLAEIFNAAIAVEAEVPLDVLKKDAKPDDAGQYTDEQYESANLFFGAAELTGAITDHFNKSGNTQPVKFRYFPLTYHTSSIWSSCIREFGTNLPTGDVLWQLSSTSSHPRGRLVTESGKKLIGLSGDILASGNVGEIAYVCTYLGSDPNYASIKENSEIELGSSDKLYIHYTPSSTNEEGETVNAEPVSIVYTGGDSADPVIIKPSGFTLVPSVDVNRQGTSWKKTDVDFNGEKKDLLALAPNEQIEMRSISKVVLDAQAKFYKNFDNKELENGNIDEVISYELKDGEYIFYTDQATQDAAYYGSGSVITLDPGARIPRASRQVEVSQILEQGLHIIPWSNVVLLSPERKITITEYQYVTLVAGDTLNQLAVDTTNTDNIEIWKNWNGTRTLGGNSQWIKCSQDAPITYTTAGAERSTELPKIMLTSEQSSTPSTAWEVCSFLELSTSPGYSQQLRAKGPSSEDSTDTTSIVDKIKVYATKPDGVSEYHAATIAPIKTVSVVNGTETEEFNPISIKLSTIAVTASGNFKKASVEDADEDDTANTSIQMKIFKEEVPSKIELDENDDVITPISAKYSVPAEVTGVSNINNYWTKIDVSSELRRFDHVDVVTGEDVKKPNAFKLNFMIPDNADLFGIFSIYLEMPVDKLTNANKPSIPIEDHRVFIDIPEEFGSVQDVISIFNCPNTYAIDADSTWQWWAGGRATGKNRVYLRSGLNCIKVAKSCSLLIKAEEHAAGSVLYDNIRLVKGVATKGVNLALVDPNATFNAENEKTGKTDEQKQELANNILNGIIKLDKNHEFYYNVPIENSLAIEFDKNINSFSNPYTLYDINNVNNSFVVSKLDIKYLKEGLRIAKSSRY